MRIALLACALLAPLVTAEPADPIRSCTSAGCVVVADTDDDGRYDWANAALIVGEQASIHANLDGTIVLWQADATTAEAAGHEIEELGFFTASAVGGIDIVASPCAPGIAMVDALVFVAQGDHETGDEERIVSRYVRGSDADGDGLPETVEGLP